VLRHFSQNHNISYQQTTILEKASLKTVKTNKQKLPSPNKKMLKQDKIKALLKG
jgi:hypothetical protein